MNGAAGLHGLWRPSGRGQNSARSLISGIPFHKQSRLRSVCFWLELLHGVNSREKTIYCQTFLSQRLFVALVLWGDIYQILTCSVFAIAAPTLCAPVLLSSSFTTSRWKLMISAGITRIMYITTITTRVNVNLWVPSMEACGRWWTCCRLADLLRALMRWTLQKVKVTSGITIQIMK